ncbi:LysR family transcriptional regulator [Salinicola sp. MH3R3-1]|uniref:LysR substrate-binding domain-containing protein n=1 Tax=Salinicola sp. MH3R3-1 TaxID=1928762 RepID=UPI00094F06BC|nr:LysR substrate-binding domain-containing protein [Salinicola sp. MH3R3-1]OLO07190.1 LysR family transcriptional regulator [Salinicola sp. MH3R3-1]
MFPLNRSLPPLATLLPFEAAARWESFTRAAEELGLTQAAISRQVRSLEKDLGATLFERRNRGVFLTPAGRELANVITDGLSRIAQQADDLRGGERAPRVILFCQLCEAFYWLMPRLATFNQRHPDIDLKLVTSTRPMTEQRDPFDIALQTHGRPSGNHTLAFIAADTIYPVCSPDHSAARNAPIPLEALAGEELLHHRAEPPDWMEWSGWFTAMDQEVSSPLPGKVFDSYPLMLQATLAGHGIALGWRRTTERLIDAGELVRPVEEFLVQPEAIAVYTHREAMDRYACRALLDWLAETLNDTLNDTPS